MTEDEEVVDIMSSDEEEELLLSMFKGKESTRERARNMTINVTVPIQVEIESSPRRKKVHGTPNSREMSPGAWVDYVLRKESPNGSPDSHRLSSGLGMDQVLARESPKGKKRSGRDWGPDAEENKKADRRRRQNRYMARKAQERRAYKETLPYMMALIKNQAKCTTLMSTLTETLLKYPELRFSESP